MPETIGFRVTPRLVLGLGILVGGLLLTADSLGLYDAERVLEYWPLLVVAIGTTKIGGRTTSDKLFALFWIGAGAWLLAWNLDYLDVDPFDFFWPIVLILLGLTLIAGAIRRRRPAAAVDSSINMVAVMGGVERQSASDAFEGGDMTAFMGGGTLDLRQAEPHDGEAVIHYFAMWGGYDIRVPTDWEVSLDVLPLLGAVEDKRARQDRRPEAPRLLIKGVVIMGGIEIKN